MRQSNWKKMPMEIFKERKKVIDELRKNRSYDI